MPGKVDLARRGFLKMFSPPAEAPLAQLPAVRPPVGAPPVGQGQGVLGSVPQNPDVNLDSMLDRLLQKEMTRRDFLEDANRASTAMTVGRYLRPLEMLSKIKGPEYGLYEKLQDQLKLTGGFGHDPSSGEPLYDLGVLPRELWDFLSEKHGVAKTKEAATAMDQHLDKFPIMKKNIKNDNISMDDFDENYGIDFQTDVAPNNEFLDDLQNIGAIGLDDAGVHPTSEYIKWLRSNRPESPELARAERALSDEMDLLAGNSE